MITLYGSGRRFGLPDASPFVTKAEILLKMAGVPFARAKADFRKAPKGKIPYIDDGDLRLGDSTFIRWHLETTLGFDFDAGLSGADRAVAWAFEKMCENELYWAIVHTRWADAENFDRGPRQFFGEVPAPLRPVVVAIVKRSIRSSLKGQGLGRHSPAEVARIGAGNLKAISDFLGDKPWLMGETPCGADAAVWSMVAGAICPHFRSGVRAAGESHANLVAYRDRGMRTWFPELISGDARA